MLHFRMKCNTPDEWLVRLDGTESNQVFTSQQIKEMGENLPNAKILILNPHAPTEDWIVYVNKSVKVFDEGPPTWFFGVLAAIFACAFFVVLESRPEIVKGFAESMINLYNNLFGRGINIRF